MKRKLDWMINWIDTAAADCPPDCENEKAYQYIADAVKTVGEAFIDLMDGTTTCDIHSMTGLPLPRCEEIYNIYQALIKEKD